ncbi:MAG: hypothetical protein DRP67_04855 [Candidatus Omnitrophota bacterium]|nr:MAG: hypothetical protein DRP67_04855 [Candidatus Omnitrophota bacterium]
MGALIGGIIAVVLGIIGLGKWWTLFVKGLKAAVPFLLLVGGIIAIAAGISDIKDRLEEKKEKEKEKEEKKEEEKKEEK